MATSEAASGAGGLLARPETENEELPVVPAVQRVCASCSVSRDRKEMRWCAQCRSVSYCSRECQKKHWKLGGHRRECKPLTTEAPASAASGSASGRGPPLKGGWWAATGTSKQLLHPCPSCGVKEDDCAESGLCFTCGQLYCSDCNPMKDAHCANTSKIHACIVCHAKPSENAANDVRLLRELLKRSVGRFTSHAECSLGACFAFGEGVPKDNYKAVPWFRRAADRGHAKAQTYMGTCYSKGGGVDIDHELAAQWFRRAADQKHSPAQFALGIAYMRGEGVRQSFEEAEVWLRRAAAQGNEYAQNMIEEVFGQG